MKLEAWGKTKQQKKTFQFETNKKTQTNETGQFCYWSWQLFMQIEKRHNLNNVRY